MSQGSLKQESRDNRLSLGVFTRWCSYFIGYFIRITIFTICNTTTWLDCMFGSVVLGDSRLWWGLCFMCEVMVCGRLSIPVLLSVRCLPLSVVAFWCVWYVRVIS